MRRIRLLTGAVVLVLSATTLAAPAYAADPAADTGRDESLAAVLAYRTVYPTISESAAKVAASQQEARKQLHDQLAKEPQTYGGGHFDPLSGVTHVALTTQAGADRAVEVGRSLGLSVSAKVVERNYDQLEALAERLRVGTDELAVAAKGRVGVEVSTNTVTVALTAQEEAALSKGAVPSWVTIVPATTDAVEEDVCTSRANCNDSLRAGLVIRRTGGGCSLGFTARSSGVRWALTAGHCGGGTTTNWSTAGTPIGPMSAVNALNAGAVDAGAIQVTNSTYAADTLGRIAISGSSWVRVNGWAQTMSAIWVGDVVCVSARYAAPATSGNPCGVITRTSDAAVRGLTRYEGYDPCPGDSGGGVYWLTSQGKRFAFGLHSRSTAGCNASPRRAWFSALPRFWPGLSYDVA
ncbi:S1 family peptidase [Micromonospora okii]|uniref:S1 family peptidase n=1 Tax=Micromonospora okii TaxID=1182970 RepID=UPI001E3F5707|nr:S1 family peptidase [Micromonospora okii]